MTITFNGINGNYEVYMDTLRAICGNTDGKSMADCCSNLAPYTPTLGFSERVYIDILPRQLDHWEEQKYFVQEDVIHYLDKHEGVFDWGICSDGIEHFNKLGGYGLVDAMEKKCKSVVFFTPLGEYMVDDSDDPEGHHSGWLPEDLFGYASIVFPQYHPTLNIGAFFAWTTTDIKSDFQRVINELKTKEWAKKGLQESRL